MTPHSFPDISNTDLPRIYEHADSPICFVCKKPVPLETAKTEEHGLAVHEQCYLLRIKSSARSGNVLHRLWNEDDGQDIAEYAVMLAVILVLVVGTIRLVGSNANNAFSSVASSLQ